MRPGSRGAFWTAALIAAALALSVAIPGFAVKKSPEQEITDNIICPCSCGEILTGCTCDTAKEMKAFVASSLGKGRTKAEITESLVAQYGEVVLGAPKAKGFNLIVWVAPILATLFGFGIALFLLKRWAGRRPLAAEAGTGPAGSAGSRSPEQDLETLRARAEEELRSLRR